MSKTKVSRLEFGWWYVRYCSVFHPYAAFDIFCEEYKKQNNCREAVREEYNDDEFDSPY